MGETEISTNHEHNYYIKDHPPQSHWRASLGSIRVTMRDEGALFSVASASDYAPGVYPNRTLGRIGGEYMEKAEIGSSQNKYKFTEKERDTETNYDYFGARYYNSKLSLWQSVDPLAEKYPGFSPYNYTLGNPLRLIDPDGMKVEFEDDYLREEHEKKYNETKDGKYVNSNYRSNYDKLQSSGELYIIKSGNAKNKELGSFSYNGKYFEINIVGNSSQSSISRIAHEFSHGVQYENGELGFFSRDKGNTWNVFNYDITDEIKAWNSGVSVATKGDSWNSDIKGYLNAGSESKGDYLRGLGGNYPRLADKSLNNINVDGNSLKQLINMGNRCMIKYNTWSEK
jgi:RHS repeat-associated protein